MNRTSSEIEMKILHWDYIVSLQSRPLIVALAPALRHMSQIYWCWALEGEKGYLPSGGNGGIRTHAIML